MSDIDKAYIDENSNELITNGFTWTDSLGRLHIHLPTLEDALNRVGLTIVKFLPEKE